MSEALQDQAQPQPPPRVRRRVVDAPLRPPWSEQGLLEVFRAQFQAARNKLQVYRLTEAQIEQVVAAVQEIMC